MEQDQEEENKLEENKVEVKGSYNVVAGRDVLTTQDNIEKRRALLKGGNCFNCPDCGEPNSFSSTACWVCNCNWHQWAIDQRNELRKKMLKNRNWFCLFAILAAAVIGYFWGVYSLIPILCLLAWFAVYVFYSFRVVYAFWKAKLLD